MRAVELLTAGIDSWHEGGSYTLLDCILWMFGDFFLYMFCAWYTDKVFPGEYGIKYPFYFLFSKNYWFPPPQPQLLPSATDAEAAGDGKGGSADGCFEEARDTTAVIQVRAAHASCLFNLSAERCDADQRPGQSVPKEPAERVASGQGRQNENALKRRAPLFDAFCSLRSKA
jgi:hypothetical protein